MPKCSQSLITVRTSPGWSNRIKPRSGAMMSKEITRTIIDKCREKLLRTKADLLNQVSEARNDMAFSEGHSGDEADQTVRLMEEKELLNRNERINHQLMAVEMALARIEQGCYGICEETGESIEPERLIALPWTSLSIEGAEIRESSNKKIGVR